MLHCNKGYTIEVLHSNAGFYIGTMAIDEECGGMLLPNCRVSQEYYKTKELAQNALDAKTFKSRSYSLENQYCGCTV